MEEGGKTEVEVASDTTIIPCCNQKAQCVLER